MSSGKRPMFWRIPIVFGMSSAANPISSVAQKTKLCACARLRCGLESTSPALPSSPWPYSDGRPGDAVAASGMMQSKFAS